MERALLREMEELERTIGELTRRKARKAGAITSPEWQIPAVRVSRRPDGFSGRQEDPASVSRDGTLAKPTMQLKLPRFNGTASLESYLAQLELAAQLASWTPEQTAGHLALALEGPALEAILDLPPAERQNLQALTAALQRRFTQHRSAEASREKLLSRYRCEEESWGKVAADPSPTGFHKRGFEHDNSGGRHPSYPAHSTTNPPARQGGRWRGGLLDTHATTTASEATRPVLPVRRAGPYRSRLPSSSTKATEAPAVGKRGRDGAVRRTPPREPTLLNQVHTPVPKPSTALPAQVAKIPATSLEASTSAFTKAAEHKSHPRVGRLGKASGLYLHCWLDGLACGALVDTGATISLVRPGVLHNTGGPQLPGAWTPTATPLTSVTGAKMAMRGKKEVKVTVTGQEVSHEFWLADIADSCIIGLDLLKRWGACVDVSRGSITLGTETVALQSGPTRKPARRARHLATTARRTRHLATTARPASKLLQLATAPKPPSLTAVPQPDHSLAHHHQPVPQQPPAQPKLALPAETTAAVHALWQRSSSGLDHQQRQQLKSLLDGNADLFAVRDEDCTQTELVQHTINTDTAQPIRLRPHRMSPAKRLVAEEKVKEMAAAGVIEPSDSPWAAPAVLVQKKSGEWRFCVDYRRLNFLTTKDSYPLPRIDEALDHISGSSWFSSLDLRSGYWQVRLAPEAKPKTAFTIGHGLWQFRVMPFGLCNAPATFERLMERVLAAVPRSRCVVYLDDLLVHASDFQQALANLTDVLAAIRQAGLRLNPKKCQLLRRETAFLGHIVSERGVATDPSKVAAVRDWPVPGNVGELRSFLGLASYYRRFVRDFATLASPLHRLTDKCRPFVWQEEQSMAFDQLRAALTEAPVLAYPDAKRPFIVDTDASNTGVGAVLSQEDEDGERVVAYYSRALGKAERNYCVTRRELLAVVRALHHFRPYLQGSHFLLRTDHASLTWLLTFKDPEGQVARWLEQLQGYDFEIRHRAGRLHGNADALSRRPCAAQECRYCSRQEERDQVSPDVAVVQASGDAEGWLPLTPMELREAQEADSTLGKVRSWLEAGQRPERSVVSAESPEVKSYYSLYSSLVQRDGLLYRRWEAPGRGSDILQLLVPRALRPDVLRLVHGSVGAGHFGNNKTLHRLRGKFHWPGCRHDVELHVQCCDSCTAQKGPSQRSRAPLQQHLVGAPMERVGVDVLGPFPVTDSGNRYILVAMDYFTKWPEAFAIPDQSAATTAERLVEEMFTRFGAPAELHSDQGRNFESQLMAEVCKRLGVTKTRTTPLHPQSDGLVERFNRTLATQLAILASQHQRDWDRHLPLVLWAYRSAVQESSQLTPAALMFGRELRTPVDLVFGAPPEPEEPSRTREEYYHRLRNRLLVAHDFARKAQASAGVKQKRWYDTRCRGRAFAAGEQVWIYCPERKKGLSPKLRASWRGPGEIVERLSEVVYRIRMPGRGRLVVLHQDRLAPYRPLATPDAAEPEVSSDTVLPSEPEPSDTPPSATRRPKRHRRPPGHLRDFDSETNRRINLWLGGGGRRFHQESTHLSPCQASASRLCFHGNRTADVGLPRFRLSRITPRAGRKLRESGSSGAAFSGVRPGRAPGAPHIGYFHCKGRGGASGLIKRSAVTSKWNRAGSAVECAVGHFVS
ncbi:hypothetical protein SKAU_G00384240 [Synaphobranchus kaupii]|uniref:Gypsy retrotransposon integrase-like protein 1 n=1 Tax=Synaphobranchus kaupii TaxID=118154 RepID=A0A9Q1EE86_SYNKA|nr:hypothetical protein SKAU_G00384240 [Synaphobranchus kaupii]